MHQQLSIGNQFIRDTFLVAEDTSVMQSCDVLQQINFMDILNILFTQHDNLMLFWAFGIAGFQM